MLVVDPPHKDCDKALVRQLRAYCSQTVVYVSCNVYTPARDVGQIVSRTAETDAADMKGGGEGKIRCGKLERIQFVFTDSTGQVCPILDTAYKLGFKLKKNSE